MAEKIRDDWWKYVISILGTIIVVLLGLVFSKIDDNSSKLDALVITSTVNAQKIEAHLNDALSWQERIKNLESGNAVATSDRITRAEVMKALDDMKEWVDKYYERRK